MLTAKASSRFMQRCPRQYFTFGDDVLDLLLKWSEIVAWEVVENKQHPFIPNELPSRVRVIVYPTCFDLLPQSDCRLVMWSACSCLMKNENAFHVHIFQYYLFLLFLYDSVTAFAFTLAHSRWKIAFDLTPSKEHQQRMPAPYGVLWCLLQRP